MRRYPAYRVADLLNARLKAGNPITARTIFATRNVAIVLLREHPKERP